MKNTKTVIRIASSDAEIVHSGVADDVVDFVKGMREDFTHEIHYMTGPSFLVEMEFKGDESKLAVLIKLVFGGLEVAVV